MNAKIIGVDGKGLADYKGLISLDMTEALLMPETYALGALLPKDETKEVFVPAGLMIFALCTEEDETKPTSTEILWLYVDKNRRRQGIASRLLSRAAATLADVGISELRCDISERVEWQELSPFFLELGFLSGQTVGTVIPGTAGGLLSFATPLSRMRTHAVTLEEARFAEVKKTLQRYFLTEGKHDREGLLLRDEGWFDHVTSRVVITDGRMEAMLLFHRRPSGCLRGILLRDQNERTAGQDTCVIGALTAARMEYGYEVPVELACLRWEDFQYLSKLFKSCGIEKLTRMATDVMTL